MADMTPEQFQQAQARGEARLRGPLAANALWALAFLAPYVSGALHGADFVFLRFSFYGGLAAVLILQMQREGAELHFRHAMKAMTLGAVGYAFSFLCTYFAVELVE